MRGHQYKTHYAHSPGQYLENFDGEAQHEIHILYSTHTKVTQMFQETILTLTILIFLFYFKKKDRRKYASCNHQIDFTICQWVLTFTVENFVIRIYLEMVLFGFTKHS